MENIKEKSIDSNYKLIDLLKFVCAFLVIGIHTRPFQASSNLLDRLFYYDISNYAVPFFYACTGYFLIVKASEESLHDKLILRCKKILRIYFYVVCHLSSANYKRMTYKEDVAVVKESFRGMLERGVYKEELFCDIK